MSGTIKLSSRDVRRLALSCQGLTGSDVFGRGRNAVDRAIRQIGYVQIDSISVVERAHHHVLRSRVSNYEKKLLHQAQTSNRSILEYWSHAAAYLPVEHYRFALPVMMDFRKHKDRWPKSDEKVKARVLDRIRSEGPLMSRDFQHDRIGNSAGWWDWKPAKWALQRLFMEGQLMVRERQGFQRVYDLPERTLPHDIRTDEPSREEYVDFLIFQYLGAHGAGTAQMMGHLRQGMARLIEARLTDLWNSGKLLKLNFPGNETGKYYTLPDVENVIPARVPKRVKLLSPFDNTVIHRQRVSEIFDFDFQLECYVPPSKRIYGYFSLPVLYGDKIIGRADCKADRRERVLHVNRLFIDSQNPGEKLAMDLAVALGDFAKFNKCDLIEITETVPGHWKKQIEIFL